MTETVFLNQPRIPAHYHNLAFLMGVLCLMGGCCCPSGPAPQGPTLAFNPANGIEFSQTALIINGRSFSQSPTIEELKEVLGPEDRIHELANNIYVWNDLGIYAYVRAGEQDVHDISVAFADQDYEFIPDKKYQHALKVSGCVIDRTTNKQFLLNNGFQEEEWFPDSCNIEIGANTVYVEHGEGGEGVIDVSFAIEGW